MALAGRLGARWRLSFSIVLACLTLPTRALAGASLRTCVTVVADSPESESSLERLVESELDQHPSHHAVSKGCESYLRVELIDLGPDGRFLTGRINTQVPYRVQIGKKGLAAAIRSLLIVVLHNDPVLLRGPRQQNWASKRLEDLRKRSLMYFGFELYQTGFVLDRQFSSLPGVALTGRREIDSLYVGLRIAGAHDPAPQRSGLRMTSLFDASVQLVFHADPTQNTSLFGGLSIGLAHQRFRGPSPYYAKDVLRDASQTGAELGLLSGVETLRATDTRLLFFARLSVPAFVSQDKDDDVVDAWVPSASLGVGLAF